MNNDLLSGLLSALKEMDPTGKIQEELTSIETLAGTLMKEQEALKLVVSGKEYLNWVYDTVSANGSVETEYPEDKYNGIEEENRRLLHTFFNYLTDLAHEQGVFTSEDAELPTAPEERAFKFKDKYFMASRLFDEPIRVCISLLDEPTDDCILLE